MTRTLVGRVALVQVAIGIATLAAMVALSFVAMTFVLTRHLDQGLLALCELGAKRARKVPDRPRPRKWLIEEMEEHRPIGVRIEVQDERGAILAADGKGPALRATDGGCSTQGLYRVCGVRERGLRFLAGASREAGLADRNRFTAAISAVAGLLALLVLALGHATARRVLASLPLMARRIAAVAPGGPDRVGTVAPFQELTTLARSFDDLLARVEEALATERRFAAEASHELRTPLTIIRGEIEALARHEPTGGPASRALGSVDKLVQLVEALLWLTQTQRPLERSDLAVVNAADVVREQVSATAARHPRRAIHVDAPDELLVRGHEPLLARAVGNLLDNAVKHTPAEADVAVRVVGKNDTIEVTVEDRGAGVPPELRERIFEPFVRGGIARATTEGFGLGLPLAAAVARAHGGELRLDLNDGPGSRFVLSLPALVA